MKAKRSKPVSSRPTWVCPTCERSFARAKQWHSCRPRSIDSHFEGKDPALRRLFDFLVARIETTAPVRIDAVKTSINLISRHHFGGVIVRSGYLRVGFLARKRVKSARIVRTARLGRHRIGHSVLIRTRQDVDDELLRWLTDARELQA